MRDNTVVTNLIIFDLDGTLLDTNAVDDHCYAAAWRDEFAIDCTRLEWSSFANVTDSGIAEELLARNGFEISRENMLRVENRFVALLGRAARQNHTRFRPIRGAEVIIERLASAGWRVAIATGAWRSSATIKLRAAGLHLPHLPLASCDGRPSRLEIVQHAIGLVIKKAGGQEPDHIVLVGDAPWDVQTARQMSLPFIGIGSGEKRARLLACGVADVLADYDLEAFANALEAAVVPCVAGRNEEVAG